MPVDDLFVSALKQLDIVKEQLDIVKETLSKAQATVTQARAEVIAESATRKVPRGSYLSMDTATVFLRRVDSGDLVAKSIKDIVEANGLKIVPGGPGRHNMRCFSAMEQIYCNNPDLLSKTLHVIEHAWHGESSSLRTEVVGGVAAFIAEAGPINFDELCQRLSNIDIQQLLKDTAPDRRRNIPGYLTEVYTR